MPPWDLWCRACSRIALTLSIVALAACGSSDAPVQREGVLRAGLWEITETVDSIEGPNITPQAIEGLKAKWVQPTHSACVMPGEVDKPPMEFFSDASGGCSFERFSMGPGKIDATINCARTDGWHVVEIAGTAKPESVRFNVNHILDSPNKSQRMAVNTSMEGKRVGYC
jgi:hypothetical protein